LDSQRIAPGNNGVDVSAWNEYFQNDGEPEFPDMKVPQNTNLILCTHKK